MTDLTEHVIVQELATALENLLKMAEDALPEGVTTWPFSPLTIAAVARVYARATVKSWQAVKGTLPTDDEIAHLVATACRPWVATFKNERDALAREQGTGEGN